MVVLRGHPIVRKWRIRFDTERRSLTVNGQRSILQERNWQVLTVLRERAPDIVRRAELIDAVWQGNCLTGEKGLNQALWAIRSALGDDARAPHFIRTVPRFGYQWIYHESAPATIGWLKLPGSPIGAIATIAGVAMVAIGSLLLAASPSQRGPSVSASESSVTGKRAYLVDQDIHVELSNGCRRILVNAGNKDVGTPVLSSDGSQLAVTVREDTSCRLVTIELLDGRLTDFGHCPTVII